MPMWIPRALMVPMLRLLHSPQGWTEALMWWSEQGGEIYPPRSRQRNEHGEPAGEASMICPKCRQHEASKRLSAHGWCVPCAFTFMLSSTRWASGNTPEAREKWTEHATLGVEPR